MTRELAQALLSLARAANLTLDDGEPHALREDYRGIVCTIVGRNDDHAWRFWEFLRQDVEALDAYRDDPSVRDDDVSEETLERWVDLSLWELVERRSPCHECVRLQGWRDGVLDVPASVHWKPLGKCETHRVKSRSVA
jgi:hypothetical protein